MEGFVWRNVPALYFKENHFIRCKEEHWWSLSTGCSWCEGQRDDGGESLTSIQHAVDGHFEHTSFLSQFWEVIWVLQACVTSKRLYSARIKTCCLSSAPSLLSRIPSIKLETGTTGHPQCACAHLRLDLETGSFEFHRFPKRRPMQMVSSERNGVGVGCSGEQHKVKVWPLQSESLRVSYEIPGHLCDSPLKWLHVKWGDNQVHAL